VVVDVFLRVIGEDLEVALASEDRPYRIASKCLYDRATEKATGMGVNTSRRWPKTPQDFVRKLNESKDTIVYKGWNYERYHVENERGVELWRVNKNLDSLEEQVNSKISATSHNSDMADADDADYTGLDTVKKEEENKATNHNRTNDEKVIIVDHILPAEPCHGCEQLAVVTSITIPEQTRKLRFCSACCDKLVKSIGISVIHRNEGAA